MATEYTAIKYSGESNKLISFNSYRELIDFVVSTPDCTGVVEVDDEAILKIEHSQIGEIWITHDRKIYEINDCSVSGLCGVFYQNRKMGGWVHVRYLEGEKSELAASASLGNYDPVVKNKNFRVQIKADLLKFVTKKLLKNEPAL